MVAAALFYLAQKSGIWPPYAIAAMAGLVACWYFHNK
jgi:hypothetical protein